jgi:hypothetical protein
MNEYKPFAYISKGSDLSVLHKAVQDAVSHHQEVVHYSSISRKMQIRILQELVSLLRCDGAAFHALDGEHLRAESIVSAPVAGHLPVDTSKVVVRAKPDKPLLFNGKRFLAWPGPADGTVAVSPGAYATIPVTHGSDALGALSATWTQDVECIPARAFANAQELAEHVAFTEATTTLQIRSLESQVKRGIAKQRRLRAELHALQARVNPHFLYNSLNSIAALVHADADAAEQMVLELGDVFRHVLHHSQSDLIPLSEELRVVRSYLQIEKKRLAGRLRIAMKVDHGAFGQHVPPLLLLPLVENAVTHGAAAKEEGATVTIWARAAGTHLRLVVGDTGPGIGNAMHQGRGKSLSNLRRRLRLHYGEAARLRRARPSSGGYRVSLLLPLGSPP